MTQYLSLYLHIPFCRIKCSYCAFNTYVHMDDLIPSFVIALCDELKILGINQPTDTIVHTVYFGGGTPSLLSPKQIETILDTIVGQFTLSEDVEISMEANPSDISSDYIVAIQKIGVNRISIGMQSANQAELELFARRHDVSDVIKAVEALQFGKMENFNLDLIYGVPGQTLSDWDNSLKQLVLLNPTHISLYALGLEEGTAMHNWVERGRLDRPSDDLAADMYDLATDILAKHGFLQYEISNWAKKSYECRHNVQYWRNLPYAGLGPGGHGYAGNIRYFTILSPHRYIRVMKQPEGSFRFPLTPGVDEFVEVDRENEIAETIIMGLRLTQEGIVRAKFRERFDVDIVDLHQSVIDKYTSLGLLDVSAERVRITSKGRLLSNVVFRDLV